MRFGDKRNRETGDKSQEEDKIKKIAARNFEKNVFSARALEIPACNSSAIAFLFPARTSNLNFTKRAQHL